MTRSLKFTFNIAFFKIFLPVFFLGCTSAEQHVFLPLPEQNESQIENETLTTNEAFTPWKSREDIDIAPGFSITLTSELDSKLNGIFQVNHEGILSLPYNVDIKANGLSVEELNQQIKSRVAQFVKDSDVRVEITKKEYIVDVQGLVQKPGQYAVRKNATIDELIFAAGGLQANISSVDYVRIDQLGVSNELRMKDYYAGRTDLVPKWYGGEVVFFHSQRSDPFIDQNKNYVQLLGQFKKPGELPYYSTNDLFDYVIAAGGPTAEADIYNAQLIRRNADKREIINFALAKYDNIPSIQAGDTIILNSDRISSYEKESRIISDYAGVISVIGVLVLIANGL